MKSYTIATFFLTIGLTCFKPLQMMAMPYGVVTKIISQSISEQTLYDLIVTFHNDDNLDDFLHNNHTNPDGSPVEILHMDSDGQYASEYDKNIILNTSYVEFLPEYYEFKPIDLHGFFQDCYKLKQINGLEYLNTAEALTMSHMFDGCEALESINVSSFDTKNVETMDFMFSGCKSLKTIDLKNFDTDKVYNFKYMFNDCENLERLDLSGFNTKIDLDKDSLMVYPMCELMVSNCWNLKKLILSPVLFYTIYTDLYNQGNGNAFDCVGYAKNDEIDKDNPPCELFLPSKYVTKDVLGNSKDNWVESYLRHTWYVTTFHLQDGKSWAGNYFSFGGYYGKDHYCNDSDFKVGDANHDGIVSVADVTACVDFILKTEYNSTYFFNGDLDKNGEISINDITNIVNLVLLGDVNQQETIPIGGDTPPESLDTNKDFLWSTDNN